MYGLTGETRQNKNFSELSRHFHIFKKCEIHIIGYDLHAV